MFPGKKRRTGRRAFVRKEFRALKPKGDSVGLEGCRPFLYDLRRGISSLKLSYCLIGKKPDVVTESKLRHKPVLVKQLRERPKVIEILRDWLDTETTLKSLDLYANHMWGEGAIKLAQGLRQNSSLARLSIRLNQIGDEGAIAIANALHSNSSVTYLDLYGNEIGALGAKAIADALLVNSTLNYISLRGNKLGNEGAVALSHGIAFQPIAHEIQSPEEPNKSFETENNIASIKKKENSKTSLSKLSMSSSSDSSESDSDATEKLDIQESLIEDTKISPEELENDNHLKMNDQNLLNAQKNRSGLTTLNLSGNAIGNQGATAIASVLKSNSGHLTRLILSKNLIGDEGATMLAQTLQTNHNTLKELDLSGCQIRDEGAAQLSEALRNTTQLKTLKLAHNQIGFDGVIHIAEALGTSAHDVSVNNDETDQIDETDVTDQTIWETNTTLETLSLIGNNIEPLTAVELGTIFAENTTLKGIKLVDPLSVGLRTTVTKHLMLRFPDISKDFIIETLRKWHWDAKTASSKVLYPIQSDIDKKRKKAKMDAEAHAKKLEKERIAAEAARPQLVLERLIKEARGLGLMDDFAMKLVKDNLKSGKFTVEHYINLWQTRIDSMKPDKASK